MLPGLLDDSLIDYVPFIDAIQAIGSFYGPPDRFKATGRFVYCPLTKTNIRNLINYVEPLTNGSYVNFPYSQLEHYGYAYYGGNYETLRKIKKLYDPENIFRFPQSIRP